MHYQWEDLPVAFYDNLLALILLTNFIIGLLQHREEAQAKRVIAWFHYDNGRKHWNTQKPEKKYQ